MKFYKNLFAVDASRRHFTAEASDLKGWNVDANITLVSDMGCEATFEMHSAQQDIDDFDYWVYVPESIEKLPRLSGWQVLIFND